MPPPSDTHARWTPRTGAVVAFSVLALLAVAQCASAAPATAPAGGHATRAAAAPPRTSPSRQRSAPATLGKLDAFLCTLANGATALPPATRHGLIGHLEPYPTPALATTSQRRAAQRLLDRLEAEAAHWSTLRAARRAGFVVKTVPREKGDLTAHYVHAERLREGPLGTQLDVRRPKALIYANEPGRPLVLVGVMFSMRRGVRGPTPGGAVTRWHSHEICTAGTKRGLAPRPDGSCPPGATRHQGSEMMHVWFTRDLRSAFAVRAPEPELCRDGLLHGHSCTDPSNAKGM